MSTRTKVEIDPENVFRHYYKQHKVLNYEDISHDLTPEVLLIDDLTTFKSPYYNIRVNNGSALSEAESNEVLNSLKTRFNDFMSLSTKGGNTSENIQDDPQILLENIPNCITVDQLPGLRIIPNYLPVQVQQILIESVIEDYIPNENHLSNLHLHYKLPRRLTLFPEITKGNIGITDKLADGTNLETDPTMKTIVNKIPRKSATSIEAIREKQLRWITLGGQYNWTTKIYPTFEPHTPEFPDFPTNLCRLLGSSPNNLSSPSSSSLSYLDFDTLPQAAIVNFYSPGDILSPHQDVAELCQNDLLSLSIGCSAIFYIGLVKSCTERCSVGSKSDSDTINNEKEKDWLVPPLAVLVKSGDILIMGGQSRFAFHGIGKVFAGTCPEYLETPFLTLPSGSSVSEEPLVLKKWSFYGSWMRNKRVNINVRQMLKKV
ncbi:hypothetical protein NADFUDRAFT_53203 [Nadsonia fulvescens var. elongata DSM 6958]|uniref:Alpha-ketoglutarate-dependent dioxygenase AlkB-like domain-containing protein n=1 Tax=Nadsonia fulvescens var. elongata DSM 6958 TaxID=857566 RepID=A0A1E3PF68_9ASCO|nr:hypothetical protein NADFUDRAFT_53203 [Nadsonia fulvescens var. elongata DSM 6958]